MIGTETQCEAGSYRAIYRPRPFGGGDQITGYVVTPKGGKAQLVGSLFEVFAVLYGQAIFLAY